MTKATHTGTCQWCGARQKLPSGVLSIHGYTTAHGWFEGVCSGSGHRPYEESCDLIEKSIAWAKVNADRITAMRDEALAIDPAATNKAWMHHYHAELSSRTKGSVYLWLHVELIANEGNEYSHHFMHNGKKERILNPGKLADKVRDGRNGYAKHLAGQLKQIAAYIVQQQARVDAWKPAELTPIKA